MGLGIGFVAHGCSGHVTVDYGLNDDPAALGFDRLGQDGPIRAGAGFPVVEARTSYSGTGYHALFGWLQVVRYTAPDDGAVFIVDRAPQFGELPVGFPFVTWGVRPTMFDAPVIDQSNVDWWADTFLVNSPDLLMTPTIQPLCCFRWGYTVDDHETVLGREPRIRNTTEAWSEVRAGIHERYPAWRLLPAEPPR